ncbi:DUF1758 domain-containing protein [Trichonephila clavipes]|nr:DUF1758 domain-containing protein [Trichonephila clavipes]
MALSDLKAKRKGLRQAFTLNLKKIESELNKEIADRKELSILRTLIDDKFQRLDNCQLLLSEELLKEENDEQLFSEDFEEAETYRDRYLENCFKIENRLQENAGPSEAEKRKFKLPKMELKKFNGNPKEFLAFWSQFKKIHDDSSIAEEDKMQYLLQSVEPHFKAERLVLSFPATAANYSKAIEQLKERFGRDDLLVQIYATDLLVLVMKNAVKGRSETDLTYLYDEFEGKLRALEILGRTQEKYGDFLIPLVESCLPEETLLAWERSRNHESTQNTRTLEHLMNFLRKEESLTMSRRNRLPDSLKWRVVGCMEMGLSRADATRNFNVSRSVSNNNLVLCVLVHLALLLRQRKDVLFEVAKELGDEVDITLPKIEFKKRICQKKYYNDEAAKCLLEGILEEIKEREITEFEERRLAREFELERLTDQLRNKLNENKLKVGNRINNLANVCYFVRKPYRRS